MDFSTKYIEYLEKKFFEDDFIRTYIEYCKRNKTIKKKALEFLMK